MTLVIRGNKNALIGHQFESDIFLTAIPEVKKYIEAATDQIRAGTVEAREELRRAGSSETEQQVGDSSFFLRSVTAQTPTLGHWSSRSTEVF